MDGWRDGWTEGTVTDSATETSRPDLEIEFLPACSLRAHPTCNSLDILCQLGNFVETGRTLKTQVCLLKVRPPLCHTELRRQSECSRHLTATSANWVEVCSPGNGKEKVAGSQLASLSPFRSLYSPQSSPCLLFLHTLLAAVKCGDPRTKPPYSLVPASIK